MVDVCSDSYTWTSLCLLLSLSLSLGETIIFTVAQEQLCNQAVKVSGRQVEARDQTGRQLVKRWNVTRP